MAQISREPGAASGGAVKRALRRRWPLLGLLALMLYSSAAHVATVQRDTAPPYVDSAGYFREIVYWHSLMRDGRWAKLAERLERQDARPPLSRLITAAIVTVAGDRSLRMVRQSQLFYLLMLLACTYGIGVRLTGRGASGLLACVLLAAYPHVFGLNRLIWMDPPMAAFIALSVLVLLWTGGLRRPWRCALLGLTLGLGMLTRPTFVVFVGGPVAYLAAESWLVARRLDPAQRWARRRQLLRGMSLTMAVALLVALPWYLHMSRALMGNLHFNAGMQELPGRSVTTLKSATIYLEYLHRNQIGKWLLVPLAVAAVPFLRHASWRARGVLGLWFLLPFLFHTFVITGVQWNRFTMPYLPALALISAVGLTRFRFSIPWRGVALAAGALAVALMVTRPYLQPKKTWQARRPWHRVNKAGMVRPLLYDPPPMRRIFSGLTGKKRRPLVGLFPNDQALTTIMEAWALSDGVNLQFATPYERNSPTCLRGRRSKYPARLLEPAHYTCFDYMVQQLQFGSTSLRKTGREGLKIFLKQWPRIQKRHFKLVHQHWLPGGSLWLVFKRTPREP